MTRFQNKVVIITGASAGIGEASALAFAAEGAQVVLAARGREKLEVVAQAIRDAGGVCLAVPTDIGVDADNQALLDATIAQFGGLDILVNNAALHHRGTVEERSPEELATMVSVNLRAPILLTRMVLPLLRARGGGAIVQVTSLAGQVPTPGAAVYSATKFGLRAFARALAFELEGSGITVSSVAPGPVDTGFIMDDLDVVSDIALSQPISTAQEVAAAILDCAADGRLERSLPKKSGRLATFAYLFPNVARRLRPRLEAKGRATKARLKRR